MADPLQLTDRPQAGLDLADPERDRAGGGGRITQTTTGFDAAPLAEGEVVVAELGT